MTRSDINGKIWARTAKGAILPIATLALVMFMIVPVPAFMLDVGFITNIMISLAVLMVALNANKPLDFSSFPTVLLFATLLRLALNVASTRVVLVNGHSGSDAAGHVIESFGNFLIGGDYVVGLFVFAILMIINLVVITKGRGPRVRSVGALHPGRHAGQADGDRRRSQRGSAHARGGKAAPPGGGHRSRFLRLHGRCIQIREGRCGRRHPHSRHQHHRRHRARRGQSWAGSRPGRADLCGARHRRRARCAGAGAAALHRGGVIVTRVNSEHDLSGQISAQFGVGKAWFPVAGILTILTILPGMPHFMIAPAAGIAWFIALRLRKADRTPKEEPVEIEPPANPAHIEWSDVSDGAVLGIEIGYGLIGLVDERKDAPLMGRITGIRRQLSRELGFVVPMIRVKDNLALSPNQYRITIAGVVVGEDEIWPDNLLALDSGEVSRPITGRIAKDPTFGLDAVWIDPIARSEAVVAGYTVVDPSTVVATHLNHLIQQSAAELFGMDEARKLLDTLKDAAPQLAEGLTPQPYTLAQVTALCRSLLAENIPLKDFRRIAEAMVEVGRNDLGADALNEAVRQRIGALIIQAIVPVKMALPVITLDGELEGLLAQAMRVGGDAQHPIEPALGQRLIEQVSDAARPLLAQARSFALVTSPVARRPLARLFKPHLPDMPVLSFLEIPDGKAVEVVAVVGDEKRHRPERLQAA